MKKISLKAIWDRIYSYREKIDKKKLKAILLSIGGVITFLAALFGFLADGFSVIDRIKPENKAPVVIQNKTDSLQKNKAKEQVARTKIDDQKIAGIIRALKNSYSEFDRIFYPIDSLSKKEIEQLRINNEIHHSWRILAYIPCKDSLGSMLENLSSYKEKRKKLIEKKEWGYHAEIDSINNCVTEIIISSIGVHLNTLGNGLSADYERTYEEYFISYDRDDNDLVYNWREIISDNEYILEYINLCDCELNRYYLELLFKDLGYYLNI